MKWHFLQLYHPIFTAISHSNRLCHGSKWNIWITFSKNSVVWKSGNNENRNWAWDIVGVQTEKCINLHVNSNQSHVSESTTMGKTLIKQALLSHWASGLCFLARITKVFSVHWLRWIWNEHQPNWFTGFIVTVGPHLGGPSHFLQQWSLWIKLWRMVMREMTIGFLKYLYFNTSCRYSWKVPIWNWMEGG